MVYLKCMIITHHGKQFFKLQVGDTVIAINPMSKSSKNKTTSFGADITLSTLHHPDYFGVEQTSYGTKEPFVIHGPGEYEVSGFSFQGRAVPVLCDKKTMMNTVYYFTFDDIRICFLGYLSNREIPREIKEMIEEVDIIFVPIGGGEQLDASEAHKLAIAFEPKIIIPMDYESDNEALKTFFKDAGSDAVTVDKLTLKVKDLLGKAGEVIAIES